MTWGIWFRVREYLRGSLWVLPFVAGVLGEVLGSAGLWFGHVWDAPVIWQYTPATASTVLASIVGAMAALTGFVVTVSILVVQMATGTFSARYMRIWYRDRTLKLTLAVLVFTLTFSFALLRRIGQESVPDVGVTVAGVLVVISLLLFLVYLDRVVHRLRPVAVAAQVAHETRKAFDEAQRVVRSPDTPTFSITPVVLDEEPILVVRSGRPGAIQAIHARGLVDFARANACLLVLPHGIGDFVPIGGTLVDVYGEVTAPRIAARRLEGMVALGVERTIEQDPAFGVRIMVDVANKALSAAINDPTTAVQVLDHLGETLRMIGSADLPAANDPALRRPGVIVPGRRWEDYLSLGVTEIREYGASSIQVNRRLRAMLEELEETVLAENRPAVRDELARLDASVEVTYDASVDGDLARRPDAQGIGGLLRLGPAPSSGPGRETDKGNGADRGDPPAGAT